jgi:hypothetical protein
MILGDFLKALGQLTDGRFLGVLAIGLGLTVALLVGFYLAFVGVIGWVIPESFTLPWIGEITWVDTALTWASVPVMLLLSSILMVPVASAFISMFLETIAAAVERKHYPDLPPARSIGIAEGLVDALKFLGSSDRREPRGAGALRDLHAACADPVLGGERCPPGPGIRAARRAAPVGRRRRGRVPPPSQAHDLRRRRVDGRAVDDPRGEPAGADPRGGHLHPPLPSPHSGRRRAQSRSA